MKNVILLGLLFITHFVSASEAADFKTVYQDFLKAHEQSDYPRAVTLAEQALALGKIEYGEVSKNTANLAFSLANAYASNKQYMMAFSTMQQVREQYKQLFGEQSLEFLQVTLNQIAVYPRTQEKRHSKVKAELSPLLNEVISLTNNLAEQSPELAAGAYYELAKQLLQSPLMSEYRRKILKYSELAEESLTAEFGDKDVRTIEMRLVLGRYKAADRKYNDAVGYFESIVSTVNSTLGTSHPFELSAHASLVDVYERMGQSEKATEHCIAIGKMTPWSDEIEPIPLYRVSPQYPIRAARNGQDGWVQMEFDLDKMGFVKNVALIESSSDDSFVKEAIKALEKWRYAPKFVDGQAVVANKLKIQLDFKLQK
ncbi:TonB family protein [Alteromonadaceae bacterium BrNp21-10]|nr:TonB family protein [Alteromonadaceae bacterium BrNp21-10]